MKNREMKPFVMVRPRKPKEKFVAIMFLIVILCGVVPIINLVNKPIIVLGFPLLMLWSIGIVIAVVITIHIALKMEVY